MRSEATSVAQYLDELPDDRRRAIRKIRSVIRKNLPTGYQERMNWGMISYEVPLRVVPKTYNGEPLLYAALASQKNHMAVYLSAIYCDADRRAAFETAWTETGKKFNAGKSCVRFKKIEDIPLHVLGEAIAAVPMAEFIETVERIKNSDARGSC